MREPMTLFDQGNVFNRLNRQRLIIDQTARQRAPVYSSLSHVDDDHEELKSLSLGVYATKHLVTAGKAILPYSERARLDELLLPSLNKNICSDENRPRRKRKRPSYRKSLFHTYSSTSTQANFTQLTARGIKPEPQTIAPMIRDDDTVDSFQRNQAPPPSPSDDEIERLLYGLHDMNQSYSFSRQSPIEKEGYIPFRLPILHRSPRVHRSVSISRSQDIRSTLSNYHQKYY